jgi:hypothetical protein
MLQGQDKIGGTSTASNSFLVTHCTKNPIYVFPGMKLHGLAPNSYIHVSVSDLYTPRIGSHTLLQQNRLTDPGYI